MLSSFYPVVALGLLFVTLLASVYWYYRKHIAPYLKFPSWFVLLEFSFIYSLLTGRGVDGVPLMHFMFMRFCYFLNKYSADGMLVVWLDGPYLVVFGEEAIKFFSREPAALDKPKAYCPLKCIFGDALILSNGKDYKKQRKIISPHFYPSMLSGKVPVVNKYAAMLLQQLQERNGIDMSDCMDLLKDCIFRMLLESSLGFESNRLENESKLKIFKEKLFKVMEYSAYRLFRPWLQWDFILNLFPYARESMKLSKDVCDFAGEILEEQKKSVMSCKADMKLTKAHSACSHEHRKTLGEVLILQHLEDPSFTMENMKWQIIAAIVGGFNTSSHALNFCFYMLGLHPDIQEEAYNELQSLADGDIEYNDLSKLTYMECIIKETLRLFPPVPMFGRQLQKDVYFGKYKVPKNTSLLTISYLSHRNPKIYPDPEVFNPSRFAEGESEKKACSYVPFAEGIRSCVGKNFAMMEMKIILSHILRNFRIVSTGSREDIVLSWELTLKSLKPLRMKFIPR